TIVRPTMNLYPWSWLFFIPFIIVTAFAVLNLFIGIIVDAMQQEDRINSHDDLEAVRQEGHEDRELLLAEVRALREDIAQIKSNIK
ncbi:MAG: ion transporter, partial [Pseudomonadota bacterium]